MPNIERDLTGERAHLQVVRTKIPLPLAKINYSCDAVEGTVTVRAVGTHLPIRNATFVLGDDLAGSLVVPVLTIRDSPLPYNPTEDIERDQPTLFPICACSQEAVAE